MTREELKAKANDLPLLPGVYLMMDKSGKVIYVGKAKKLKNRVSQYFQDSASHTAKTRQMVSQVDHFDTIFVSSEFEALVLENSLIKRHMPRYNILLKDDKGYPFVRLSRETYPRFTMTNRAANDSARYFGPFGGRFETRQALDAVLTALRLPTCSRKFPRDIGAERPCLNFHMGRCDGFCRPDMTAEEYNRRIQQACQLLEGKSKQLLREMTAEMEAEAEALRFEQAAQLRDRINAIAALSKKQTVIAGLCADTDIWGLYRGAGKCCYAILHMENGNLAGRETELFAAPMEETEEEMLSSLTAQYYLPRAILPHEILLPFAAEGYCEDLSQVLTKRAGRKVWVHVPQRGEKADLQTMAQRNAAEEAERATTAQERVAHTLEVLGKLLDLPAPPGRMESFDISNTGKSDIVASMVVYSGTRPLKSAYRRFRIKELAGHPDDYASMQEVLRRRLQRAADGDEKFLPLPDVFLIDGGETHARAALAVAEEFGVSVPIFGMVKDDRHRTRALVTPEGREIGIVNNQAVFSLIGQIQEETHRFAITYHHESHTKSTMKSALDGIPSLGPKRREELRKHFGTIKAIKEADVDTLAAVVPRNTAEAVWKHFHENE
ncbi:excinuclease ABC subunit UvrC [Oscillibacter valericigenes]|uniref:excinuclease ABC subunit UvrC n=1 Tax=Oscillibacter valericigenes TaxID=351091 RepID=UPI001F350A73|nr:excinuclease ABC subunit UvrC [Oscillibacter valericigenes]MCF2663555.1 excinuclease ABC subunit UvrC [Oscillibacter valericigenes]